MEDQGIKGSASDRDSSIYPDGSNPGRFRREATSTELVMKMPFWFRFLLAIPEINIQSILGYLILPILIIESYVLTFIYVAFTVHSMLAWILFGCLLSPLLIVSASAKAHRTWTYLENMMAPHPYSSEVALEEYLSLVKKKD